MASPSLFMNVDHDHDNMDIRPTWEAETIERQQPVNCDKVETRYVIRPIMSGCGCSKVRPSARYK